MRATLLALPLLLCAGPALAQAQPTGASAAEVERALAGPATADRLANVMQAMSQAFLDLPVGQVQAAIEGRPPTMAERHMTLRELARHDDKNFDRDFRQRIANARPMVAQSMKALQHSLPAIMQGFQQAKTSLDRAIANMPDPTYPKR